MPTIVSGNLNTIDALWLIMDNNQRLSGFNKHFDCQDHNFTLISGSEQAKCQQMLKTNVKQVFIVNKRIPITPRV